MGRAVVFKIYGIILWAVVAMGQLAFASADINLNSKDLAFLKAVKQETLAYVQDQTEVTEAFKVCLERNICDVKFHAIDSSNLPFAVVFDNKQELLGLIRKLHTKFRTLTALRNKNMYETIKVQDLAFLAPMSGMPAMRFVTWGEYGRAEMDRVFKIIEDDNVTKQVFKDKMGIHPTRNYREDHHTDYNLELMAIDTYEVQMTQMLSALPMFNEVMYAEVGRREAELSEQAIIAKMNVFLNNLAKTKRTVEAIAEDNVVDTLMFPVMVSQVLAKNSDMLASYEKLSAYTLARKNLFTAFIDKFTNTITWALIGCIATSIIVPKAAPLIMGVCGTLGLGTLTVMMARTWIEIEKISPLVRIGLVDPSNLSHLYSVLTHQLLMTFIVGTGVAPSILRLAKASTFSAPTKYYSQMVREMSNRATSQQAWRAYAREHLEAGRQELGVVLQRLTKANAKDLAARVPASAVYQAYNLVPAAVLMKYDLFEIFTLSDSLRLKMSLLGE